MADNEIPTLICPSEDACKAFGIRRGGSNESSPEYTFLKGPQFKGVKVSSFSGNSSAPIDEVILEFIGNKPVKIIPKNEGGIVKMEIEQKETAKTLYTLKIAPNTTDWLSFGFNHEWSEGDGIMSKILDTVSSLIDSASGIINTAQNVAGGPTARRKVTLDKQDTYQKTDKVEVTIPFLLFSSGYGKFNSDGNGNPVEQWVKDVYEPLMVITALTHPKRQTGVVTFGGKPGEGGGVTGGTTVNTATGEQTPSPREKASENTSTNIGDDVDNAQENALRFLSSYPGMRVAISEPPSYVRVKHSSGFFQYNVCAITSFKYSFKGPWVKAYSLTNGKVFENDKKLMSLTLPMVAECSMTIKVVEKMYADDYIDMFKNSPIYNNGGAAAVDGIVSVYQKPQ